MEQNDQYVNDLRNFKEFLKSYDFHQLEIIENQDGTLFCEGEIVKDINGYRGESSKWINVGYTISGTFPKLLSNLFHYEFYFQNLKLNSLESFFSRD